MNKKSLAIGIILGVLVSGILVFALEEGQIFTPDEYNAIDFSIEYLDCQQEPSFIDLASDPATITVIVSCLDLELQDDGNYLTIRNPYLFKIDLAGEKNVLLGDLPSLEQCQADGSSPDTCWAKVYAPFIYSEIAQKRKELADNLEASKDSKIPIDLDLLKWSLDVNQLNS